MAAREVLAARTGLVALAAAWIIATGTAQAAAPADWAAIEQAARGQTVYFNAWAGDAAVNRYIDWAASEIRRRHGVEVVHVKVTDISEAVSRLLAEQAAGRTSRGSIDLLWINGENFASLKQAGLLFRSWVDELPNARWLDVADPTQRFDFTLSTEGLEMPWGGARLTMFHDSQAVPVPPADTERLLVWIRAHPGRFTYPQPPDFIGTSFLKQLLLLLVPDPERFAKPVGSDFATVTAPLWAWLDAAHPHLWRSGRAFPRSGPEQRRLLGDGEVDWAIAFNPAEGARAVRTGELPASIRSLHLSGGALANTHFLAIPFNASASEGARVAANFLLSAEAQARKADVEHWGDPTVLDLKTLPASQRALFQTAGHPALPAPPTRLLGEPHPSWTSALERAWSARYGAR